ncbi:MAG: homoserine kinase [Actinobacteria bacterium]|nr:homoserine kinase [Actinomycetota bacterium]MCL5446233.1 homoserine kinase [Actinomycetota bacterium]
MRARAPASAANLGPGFDVLALALDLYVEVEVNPAPRLTVSSSGEGAEYSGDANHLAAMVAMEVAGHDRLSVSVHSSVPVARGLGSSAALAIAAAAAAGSPDPLAAGVAVDGHPENAAASFYGGLVAATVVRGKVRVVRFPLDEDLAFVALIPSRSLSTKKARTVLPEMIHRSDATFNLGRMAMLLAGLGDRSMMDREACADRLHQDYRSPLFPQAPSLMNAMLEAGALAACWSGAGPTLLAICDLRSAANVLDGARSSLHQAGMQGHVIRLKPDMHGLQVGEDIGD